MGGWKKVDGWKVKNKAHALPAHTGSVTISLMRNRARPMSVGLRPRRVSYTSIDSCGAEKGG